MKIGAHYSGNGTCEFVVWAPFLKDLSLKVLSSEEKFIPLEKDTMGYWKTIAEDISPGIRYLFTLEPDKDRPDPASHFQPEGVHKASQVVDHASFQWEDDAWQGIPLSEMIMYELHIGTFTPEGTFDAVIPRLDEFKEVGINAIQIMPVAQFPGERNWGYDGVFPFAVQNSYGGPEGLKKLVNACHKRDIAVILDVVYNHLGAEGNYLWDFGPYFTDTYKTPWGEAINFDGRYSDEVRYFFIENALYWFTHYHIDALRLDAIHAIYDNSALPFLQELTERVEAFSQEKQRTFYLIAESDLNDAKIIRARREGGYGLHAQWCDDFHHSLSSLLTNDDHGYYVDFGKTGHLLKSLREGFVYSGEYSQYRKRNHGNSSRDLPADRFVVFSQNHDQVGNRMLGERLSSLVSFESQKLAAGMVILSPYIPLLFMGEEYSETSPFLYFVSHSDPHLIDAVRKGRKEEFKAFNWEQDPPDPQSMNTFVASKIQWEKRHHGDQRTHLLFSTELIRLRKDIPALSNLGKNSLDVWADEDERIIIVRRWHGSSHVVSFFNFHHEVRNIKLLIPEGRWKKILDSSDTMWNGPGSLAPERLQAREEITQPGESFALYIQEE